jgi:hypothetical protein
MTRNGAPPRELTRYREREEREELDCTTEPIERCSASHQGHDLHRRRPQVALAVEEGAPNQVG